MLKVELAHIVIPLLLITTPIVADVNSEMARCQLEAEHLYPIPPNKGGQNWPDRAANLQKRAEGIETCMRAAGYRVTAECSAPLKTYEQRRRLLQKTATCSTTFFASKPQQILFCEQDQVTALNQLFSCCSSLGTAAMEVLVGIQYPRLTSTSERSLSPST
jgi:hypothetical protein